MKHGIKTIIKEKVKAPHQKNRGDHEPYSPRKDEEQPRGRNLYTDTARPDIGTKN